MKQVYFPPYRLFTKAVEENDSIETVTLPKNVYNLLLRALFLSGGFDPEWYRAMYPDVAQAIDQGTLKDEIMHFIRAGYPEGRLPCVFDVDDNWYRHRYPDVDTAIRAGKISTAHHHYNATGFREGRYPSAEAEEWGKKWFEGVETQVISEE